jgi:hypothetical protein
VAAIERNERTLLLSVAATYALTESAIGLLLVVATLGPGRVPTTWVSVVAAVGRNDVGAFVIRSLIGATRGLQRGGKSALGLGLLFDGSVRAAVLVGVLRGQRGVTVAAAMLFGALALGGAVVMGLNPPIIRLVTGCLGLAVAAVIGLEAAHLLGRRARA